MTVHQRRRLMMLVLAAALVVPAIMATNASAIIKVLPNGQTVSYMPLQTAQARKALIRLRPFDMTFTNMDYNGGPVMPSNTDYMVLWSPTGLSAYPAGLCLRSGDLTSRTWPTTAAGIRTSTRCRPSTTT